MFRRVALVRADVSEERVGFIIRVKRFGELGTTLACVVPRSPILLTLLMQATRSSETSVLTIVTRPKIPEDAILYSHSRAKPQLLNAYNNFTFVHFRSSNYEFATYMYMYMYMHV
jgi:hypothetical protein